MLYGAFIIFFSMAARSCTFSARFMPFTKVRCVAYLTNRRRRDRFENTSKSSERSISRGLRTSGDVRCKDLIPQHLYLPVVRPLSHLMLAPFTPKRRFEYRQCRPPL